jgi:hypothetical protein
MKLAALLSRHRRLLALCGMSAAIHLLVLELAARHDGPPPSAPPVGEALRLLLVQAEPAPAPDTASQAAGSNSGKAAPAPEAAEPLPATTGLAAATATAPATAAARPLAAPPEASGAPLIQMPSRYRVRMPDPVRLSYEITRQAPASAPAAAGAASIDWRSDGDRYSLALDGVLGRLSSEGRSSDAGIAPRRAVEEREGASLVTEFDAGAGRILFRASGASVPDAVGAQDRASLLMQLAGMGLAVPDQIQGQAGEELRIVVAGADGAEIARYQVMGQERVPTALGELDAWRLAQVVPAGQDRIEVWLAPARGWLPVQLRLTRPDGSVLTQTLTAMEPGAAR